MKTTLTTTLLFLSIGVMGQTVPKGVTTAELTPYLDPYSLIGNKYEIIRKSENQKIKDIIDIKNKVCCEKYMRCIDCKSSFKQ